MAIKDWKRTWAVLKGMQSWEKGNEEVTIDYGLDKHYTGVSVSKNYKTKIEKIFKTKSQALKFAKSYMRRH